MAGIQCADQCVVGETILDRLYATPSNNPDSVHATWIKRSGESDITTYRSLMEGAQAYAASIARKLQARRSEVVVIMLDHGPAIAEAFIGAMMAGHLPTIFPNNASRVDPEAFKQTITQLLTQYYVKLIICDPASSLALQPSFERRIHMLSPHDVTPGETYPRQPTDPGTVAFLQHSSGTTGLKKGVALTHETLLMHIDAYAEAIQLTSNDKIVSWLPLYHDMGLVASLLMPFLKGVPTVFMDPFHWIGQPELLMQALSEYQGTVSWLPNFSYFVLADVPEGIAAGVRLDAVRALINCSEPITPHAHERLLARWAPYGLRPEVLHTCYGMAENTFAVTQSRVEEPLATLAADLETLRRDAIVTSPVEGRTTQTFVSSGRPLPTCHIKIIDASDTPLPDGCVGEICVRSDYLFREYHGRPDLTASALFDGWYHSGDLGFHMGGELFVTGRKNDLIIVAGINIYPHDIEEVAAAVEGVCPGRVVAFGAFNETNGTEELALLAEINEPTALSQESVKTNIRERVSRSLGYTIDHVECLPRGWLIKSTSGKLSRSACREKWLASRATPEQHLPPPPTEVTSGLRTMLPIAIPLELLLQFLAILPAAYILYWGIGAGHVVALGASIWLAYGAARLSLIALTGLTVGLLPKPTPGNVITDEPEEMRKYGLLLAVTKMMRRSFARQDYHHVPVPGSLYFRLCGAKIGKGVVIVSPDAVQDPYLLEIGDYSELGEGAIVSGHYAPNMHTLYLGRVRIGRHVLIGAQASVWANVIIGDGAVVQEKSAVAPGTVIGPGEIWGGNPAIKLWGPATPAPRPCAPKHATPVSPQTVLDTIRSYTERARGQTLDARALDQPLLFSGLYNSRGLVELLTHLRQTFAVTLDLRTLSLHSLTARSLAQAVVERGPSQAARPIR